MDHSYLGMRMNYNSLAFHQFHSFGWRWWISVTTCLPILKSEIPALSR